MLVNTPGGRAGVAEHNRDYATPLDERAEIAVHREWNGWRTAMVRVTDLKDVHWFQPSGAPRPLIHGYVCCTNIRSGDISHDCQLTAPPHSLLVCVLKSHTPPVIFERLARRADERSGKQSAPRPAHS